MADQNIRNWHAKNYLDGQTKEKLQAKINSDGTPKVFPVSCPGIENVSFGVEIGSEIESLRRHIGG